MTAQPISPEFGDNLPPSPPLQLVMGDVALRPQISPEEQKIIDSRNNPQKPNWLQRHLDPVERRKRVLLQNPALIADILGPRH